LCGSPSWKNYRNIWAREFRENNSSTSNHCISQKEGKICAFIDAEHALDVLYAKNLGVDVENLLVSQPDFGEQALDILENFS